MTDTNELVNDVTNLKKFLKRISGDIEYIKKSVKENYSSLELRMLLLLEKNMGVSGDFDKKLQHINFKIEALRNDVKVINRTNGRIREEYNDLFFKLQERVKKLEASPKAL